MTPEEIAALVEKSSLGTAGAKSLRARTKAEQAQRVVEQAQQDSEDVQTSTEPRQEDSDLSSAELSHRMREILDLAALGYPMAQIAALTGLSVETVVDMLGRIRRKVADATGRPVLSTDDLYRRALAEVEAAHAPVRPPTGGD